MHQLLYILLLWADHVLPTQVGSHSPLKNMTGRSNFLIKKQHLKISWNCPLKKDTCFPPNHIHTQHLLAQKRRKNWSDYGVFSPMWHTHVMLFPSQLDIWQYLFNPFSFNFDLKGAAKFLGPTEHYATFPSVFFANSVLLFLLNSWRNLYFISPPPSDTYVYIHYTAFICWYPCKLTSPWFGIGVRFSVF